MKLLLVIVEGQIYLVGVVAIFVAEFALLFWGLWSRRPIIGLVAVFSMVPLMRSTLSTIRACFFTIREPHGLRLARTEGRALYDLVDEIRRAIDAPPVDRIIVTGGFNASAVVHSPWRLHRRRTLVLGLPVLATLSGAELRAVIAHELAHFSSAYDRFAAWVYRTNATWFELRAALDRRLATPLYVYWVIRWYVPRLNAAAAEDARRHELVADRIAANVAGTRATADALAVMESGARYANEVHWPAVRTSHETDADTPRPFSQMVTWKARATSTDVLNDLLAEESDPEDTHPTIRERCARLGETVRLPPPILSSAGDDILGAELATLAARLDQEWVSRHAESWHQLRREHLDKRTTLARLAAIAAPTADERFLRAELVEALEGPDEALPIYQSAAAEGHPAAGLAAGRLLLDRMDSTGIALIEDSMERDDSLVPEACRVLAAYYREAKQELAARKCEWRATRHTTRRTLLTR